MRPVICPALGKAAVRRGADLGRLMRCALNKRAVCAGNKICATFDLALDKAAVVSGIDLGIRIARKSLDKCTAAVALQRGVVDDQTLNQVSEGPGRRGCRASAVIKLLNPVPVRVPGRGHARRDVLDCIGERDSVRYCPETYRRRISVPPRQDRRIGICNLRARDGG